MTRYLTGVLAAGLALASAAPASAGTLSCTDAFLQTPVTRAYVECVTETGTFCLIFFDPGPGQPYPVALVNCLA